MSIGDNIRLIRQKRNLSIRKVAEEAGVSEASLSRWENGDRTPSATVIEKIANALDVSVQDFYDTKDNSKYYGGMLVDIVPYGRVTICLNCNRIINTSDTVLNFCPLCGKSIMYTKTAVAKLKFET